MPLNTKIQIFIFSLAFAITSFYLIAALYYPKIYVFATYEDLYGEWGQTFFFAAASILFALNAYNQSTLRQCWFFALMAFACFGVVMEEISWGQRLFNFETPKFFQENSYQNETNLHNLLTGPVDSWSKTFLTYAISVGLFSYGAIYPLVRHWQWKPALFLNHWGIFPPPLALSSAFIFGGICELELFSFNEAEVAELLVAMSLAYTGLYYWLIDHPQSPIRQNYFVLGLLFSVVSAAGLTTTLLLNDPQQHEEINQRLANGYEKFADRYEGYNHYLAVAQMLEQYDKLRPDNTVILRRIADNYAQLGLQEKHDEFIYRAIEIGLNRYQKDPDNVAAAVSLAKSYHQVNRPEKVYFYGHHAYDIALRKFTESGEEAGEWAYWLAKSCELINQQKQALKYFRKAHHLEPDNERYERAYYEKKQLLAEYYEEDDS